MYQDYHTDEAVGFKTAVMKTTKEKKRNQKQATDGRLLEHFMPRRTEKTKTSTAHECRLRLHSLSARN